MGTPDIRAEVKKALDELPDERLTIALELLNGLRNQEPLARTHMTAVYPWMQALSEADRAEFLTELLYATKQASLSGNWGLLEEVIDAWQETAAILADADLVTRLQETQAEIQQGKTSPWNEVKQRLHIS